MEYCGQRGLCYLLCKLRNGHYLKDAEVLLKSDMQFESYINLHSITNEPLQLKVPPHVQKLA